MTGIMNMSRIGDKHTTQKLRRVIVTSGVEGQTVDDDFRS